MKVFPTALFGEPMAQVLQRTLLFLGCLSFAGCSGFTTPVAVLPPSPANAGKDPTHVGVACAHKLLWVFNFGDSHIRTAKKNGSVGEIATVEYVQRTIIVDSFPLNFYKRQCTEVSGYS